MYFMSGDDIDFRKVPQPASKVGCAIYIYIYPDSTNTSGRRRPDVGRCRQRRRADVGNDVGPISAKGRPMFTRHCRHRPDRMLAHRLDVGPISARSAQRRLNVGSRYRPDIGNRTAGVHPTLPISARPRDCTEARCRPDVGNVGSMSEADIGPTCIPDIAFVLNY